jgi:hypothetical protein
VSLDLQVPGEGPVVIETIGMGELLGWSCLFPPYSWAFGAVAATPVEAFEFDAPAVREACAADAGLGYELKPADHPGAGQAAASHQDQADIPHRLLGRSALMARAPGPAQDESPSQRRRTALTAGQATA